MRRISSGNEENLIEADKISCLLRNGEVPIVNGIEAASQNTQTGGTQVFSSWC
jgi:hypothetical protein